MTEILKFLSLITICIASAIAPVKSADLGTCKRVAIKDTVVKEGKNDGNQRSPKTIAILATIPGLGQFCNRDFWKVPIVYASLGGSIFAYHLNSLRYQDFLKGYLSFYDLNTGNPAHGITDNTRMPVVIRNLFNTERKVELLTRDQIVSNKDIWRRYRNVSILTTGLIYVLSIIEANVAAHLKTFDISDDISFQISPDFKPLTAASFCPGLQIVFAF